MNEETNDAQFELSSDPTWADDDFTLEISTSNVTVYGLRIFSSLSLSLLFILTWKMYNFELSSLAPRLVRREPTGLPWIPRI